MKEKKPILIRVTTIALSLRLLLTGQMKFMHENGFDVFMISARSNTIRELEEKEKAQHISVPMTRQITPIMDLYCLIKLIIIFSRIRPQIVHTHTPKAGLLGMMAGWICGVPVRLHTIAGLPLIEAHGVKRKVLMFVEKLTYKLASNVNPNSKWTKDYILNSGLTRKNKVIFIGHGSTNGVDIDYFKRTSAIDMQVDRIRKKMNIGKEDFVFIFIGRIVADKGIGELVEAFLRLKKTSNRVKLLLIGPLEDELDPLSPPTKSSIEQAKEIHYLDFRNDVRPYLALSNVLVLPSYREGFPNTPLQASAMGIPSIVTDISGANELIVDGVNGLVIKPKDVDSLFTAMGKMVNANDLSRMGQLAREKVVKYFDHANVQKEIYKTYLSLLDKKLDVSEFSETTS